MKHAAITMIAGLLAISTTTAVAQQNTMQGNDGDKYVPYEKLTGNESIVYFTRSLTPPLKVLSKPTGK